MSLQSFGPLLAPHSLRTKTTMNVVINQIFKFFPATGDYLEPHSPGFYNYISWEDEDQDGSRTRIIPWSSAPLSESFRSRGIVKMWLKVSSMCYLLNVWFWIITLCCQNANSSKGPRIKRVYKSCLQEFESHAWYFNSVHWQNKCRLALSHIQ